MSADDAVVVHADGVAKTFQVADKDPGFTGTLKHLVRRRTRDIEAVRPTSFAVRRGELVGVLGANGAGKTTTLKMLAGLIKPTAGQARVLGHDPFRRERAYLERITFVMGNKQQLIWDLPALDSLRIQAAIYGLDDDTARVRTAALAEMLALDGVLTQPVRKLSLGQRMKAELLCSLLHEPELLFLDEPTLGLDVNAQDAVRRFLADYNRTRGATVLLTSHYMADIAALCERVLVINEGVLVFDGALSALVARADDSREIALELSRPPTDDERATLLPDATVDGVRAQLVVSRADLAARTGALLSAFDDSALDVVDLAVKEPPLEKIVGTLFSTPAASPPS